ncbi:MAG: DUF3794 domain-containing protein [Clostridia bacterium]|nr:DUF3794 domain-containing protein [Clostridia bacterium]
MMQIDFQKETLSVSELVANQTATLLVEGDVIVPDIKPDIKEILLTEATAVVTNQNYVDGKLSFSGSASVKILYIPDGEDCAPKHIETKLEFKDTLELSQEEGLEFSLKTATEHIEFSLINSRKLNMKVVVSVGVRSYSRRDISLLTGTEGDCPLKVRTKTLSAYQVVADTEKELVITELLEIPAAKPDADELIQVTAKALKGDCKIMSGKMLLKGSLLIHTLYNSVDAEHGIQSVEHELPFGEMAELPGLDDGCLCNVSYSVKDVFYTLHEDVNGDPRAISLDVVLRAEILATKTRELDVIDDCYSLSGRTDVSRSCVQIDELLCEGVSHLNLKEILSVPKEAPSAALVYSLDCKPKVQELLIVDEKLVIRGKLIVFVLYGSAEGDDPMYSLVREYDFEHSVPADGANESVFCECGITDQNISFTLNAASEIELRCMLEFYTRVVKKTAFDLIGGCEIHEEEAEAVADRGLVIYFAQKGDTLWDIAKFYRIDQEKIMGLNQMDHDKLLAGQKLLIPRG